MKLEIESWIPECAIEEFMSHEVIRRTKKRWRKKLLRTE
jgi:hypothetical protein